MKKYIAAILFLCFSILYAGEVPHTSKFKPWRIQTAIAFDGKEKACAFEKYLKTGSGREFTKRHF